MNITRTHRRFITIATLIASPLTLVGCSSSSGPHHAGDIGSIRSNPSPAMHTLTKRDSDRFNTHAIVRDSNFRMLSNDIDRMFYMDRPSRLHLGVKP